MTRINKLYIEEDDDNVFFEDEHEYFYHILKKDFTKFRDVYQEYNPIVLANILLRDNHLKLMDVDTDYETE